MRDYARESKLKGWCYISQPDGSYIWLNMDNWRDRKWYNEIQQAFEARNLAFYEDQQEQYWPCY